MVQIKISRSQPIKKKKKKEANQSGSTLFVKAEHIRVQQDLGYCNAKHAG